jgi:hypothetical protein
MHADAERIRIVAELTIADQVAMTQMLVRTQVSPRRWWYGIIIGLGFGIAASCYLLADPRHLPAIIGALAGAWFAMILRVVVVRLHQQGFRRTLAVNPFLGLCAFEFGPEGLTMTGEGYRFDIAWDVLQTVIDSPRALLILHNPLAGWWIPRAAFASQAEVDALVALMRRYQPGLIDERRNARGRVIG